MAWFKREKVARERLHVVSGAPAVELRQVSFSRAEKVIFASLSLRLDERRIGIIGDNGSGKSTLARLFNGLILPDSGYVTIYGHESQKQQVLLPQLVGFLFQNPDHQILFPTVLEELSFGLTQLGDSQAVADQKAKKCLLEQGKSDWADRPAQSLSEGEKQRLCLWSVVLMGPKLLVLDETFASLDLRTRIQMMNELKLQKQQLIMVTHELNLLSDFDRVIWLHHGQIKADGDPLAVIAEYRHHAGVED